MKDVRVEKYLSLLDGYRRRRNDHIEKDYMSALRYCEEIRTILHFLWMSGGIDHQEFKKLEKKYRVSGKDMRKYVYCVDLINEEMDGKKISIDID